jgi:NADH-quinone oxidoreductase subunit K
MELVLLSINLIFLTSSAYFDDLFGNLVALIILTVAAAESSLGLALVIRYYRTKGTVSTEFLNLLRG